MARAATFLALLLFAPAATALFAPVHEPVQAWIWSDGDLDAPGLLDLEHHAFTNLGMATFLGTAREASDLVLTHGGRVTPNEIYELHLDRSVPTIEADRVAEVIGYQRNGPSVMVVDTGVDSTHPDFQAGNLPVNIAADRFGGLVRGVLEPDVVVDEAGHGTHVAGIVAGSGESLGRSDRLHDRFKGVYHTGRIIGFQALAEDTDEPSVDTAAALQAFDWAIENKDRYEVRVVQNSWGLPGDLDVDHPVNRATLDLYLAGINVIFSAGNRGDEPEALNRHCMAPWVLCVGSVDNDGDRMTESSIGPGGFNAPPYAHPDISAPGVAITATGSIAPAEAIGSPTGFISNLLSATPSNELYEIRSGTSMAAPHVAGVAALLLAANGDLSPDQVMDILVESSIPLQAPVHEVGAGMLNARTAYNLAVQTPGNRDAFEAGEQVKYAGARTNDPDNALDPISVGYTDTPTGGPVLPPPARSGGLAGIPNIGGFALGDDVIGLVAVGLGVLLVVVMTAAITVAVVRR